MVAMKSHRFRNLNTLELIAEGQSGSPADQTRDVLTAIHQQCEQLGGGLSDLVFVRFWVRSRSMNEEVRAIRREMIDDNFRIATSSFIDGAVFQGNGDVRAEALICSDIKPRGRRIVEFDPPRRYPHYLEQKEGLFMSGMAEVGATHEDQCEANIRLLNQALRECGLTWQHVSQLQIFRERSQNIDLTMVLKMLANECDLSSIYVTHYEVDGLASTNKHLEIELFAPR